MTFEEKFDMLTTLSDDEETKFWEDEFTNNLTEALQFLQYLLVKANEYNTIIHGENYEFEEVIVKIKKDS